VAVASARISRLGHGLPLLPSLEECGSVDVPAANNLRADTSAGWSAFMSVSRDHGWTIGKDNRTWRHPRLRWTQARERAQAPHPGRHVGLLIASRVEPANVSDRRAGEGLLAGSSLLFPRIQTVIADTGHQSRKLARRLLRDAGWKLQIVKRGQRAFKITGLTWIVERSFAWLGRNRRLSKDYEYHVQTSKTMLDVAAIRLMLNRLTAS